MQLEERISDYVKKCFQNWEATEQVVDEGKAFYMLKNPNNNVEKVCMFRDGFNMMIYGDYGCYHFDEMTWFAAPYNLAYNNLSYQMEKLSQDSKDAAYEFDSNICGKDFLDWIDERLEERFDLDCDSEIKNIKNMLNTTNFESFYDLSLRDKIKQCLEEEHKDLAKDIQSLFILAVRGLQFNEDREEWISFLRENREAIEKFDDFYESGLFDAGWRIKDRLLVSLYAMQVCGEKLKEKELEKENEGEERE